MSARGAVMLGTHVVIVRVIRGGEGGDQAGGQHANSPHLEFVNNLKHQKYLFNDINF